MSEPGAVEQWFGEYDQEPDSNIFVEFEKEEALRFAREHDAADARLTEENEQQLARRAMEIAALRIGLLIAHEYCCDDFEVLCRPDNCQIQQALTGDARILDRENRDSSIAAIALLKRDLARREALLRALADIFEGHAGDGCSIWNEVDDAALANARAALAAAQMEEAR